MPLNYPPTRRDDVVDELHGVLVADPYRWLESVDDPETRAWITAQNRLTERFLAGVPAREAIRARLSTLWDYPRYDVPFERGGQWFQWRNTGLQDQPVLYVGPSAGSQGRPLLDPNTPFKGRHRRRHRPLRQRGRFAAGLCHQRGGIGLEDLAPAGCGQRRRPRRRDRVVASSAGRPGAGTGRGSTTRPWPVPIRAASSKRRTDPRRILFHRIGTPPEHDVVVFAAPDHPDWLPTAVVSDDDRYLIVSIQRGTNPESQIEVLDLRPS